MPLFKKDENKDLLSKLNDLFVESSSTNKHRRDKWKKHYNYWINKQLSKTRPKYKSDMRVNYCWVITQVKIPVMTQNKPTVNFISFDKTPEAENRASTRSKLVGNALWNKLEVQDTLVDVIWDSIVYDAGFWKIGWDPTEDNGIGEVFASSIEPFKILTDPAATKLQKGRYVIHLEMYPVSYLKSKYKKFSNKINPDKAISDILFEYRRFEDRKPTSSIYTESTEFSLERAYLKEFWLASSECDMKELDSEGLPKYRNGRVITVINDNIIVDDKPNPYNHGRFPFVKQIVNKVGNEFWGMGDLEQIIPLQDALNHAYQQIDDIANKTSNLGWTVHSSVGIAAANKLADKMDKPGSLKMVDPALIKRDDAPRVPAYLINRIEMIERKIEIISGITDIMQGSGRFQHRTARGLERIYESATSRIGLSIRLMERALKQVAFMMAEVSGQFYTEERTFALIGSSGVPTGSLNVMPEDLTGEYEVSVDSGVALPQDKQSKADLVFHLLGNHIFEMALGQDPLAKKQAEVVLNAVEFPGREDLLNFVPPAPEMPEGMPGMPPGMPGLPPEMPAAPTPEMPPAMPGMPPAMPGMPPAMPPELSPEVLELQEKLGARNIEELIQMLTQG